MSSLGLAVAIMDESDLRSIAIFTEAFEGVLRSFELHLWRTFLFPFCWWGLVFVQHHYDTSELLIKAILN